MIILAIKTDSDTTEFSLFDQKKIIDTLSFKAKRQLADKIHLSIKELLDRNKYKPADINGIIAYLGPGSFTGLRIGLSVANTLAYSLKIPICRSAHQDWPDLALERICSGHDDKQLIPFYGAEPNITKPKK